MKKATYTVVELLQMLANATLTHYVSGGHTKARRNEEVAEEYKRLLLELKEPIPTDAELLKVGVFNGKGSW